MQVEYGKLPKLMKKIIVIRKKNHVKNVWLKEKRKRLQRNTTKQRAK